MKKFKFFGMMAVAAMAVSCSSDDVVQQVQEDNAIQFSTYLGNAAQSRGSEVRLDEIKAEGKGFGVFAYYTGTTAFADYTGGANFMNNQQVTWDEEGFAWTYSPIKYWPNNNNELVSFFAYAPYDVNYVVSGEGKVTYEVPADVTLQRDLLWSRSNTTDLKKQSLEDNVQFVFAHALAKIGLTVSCAADVENAVAAGTIEANTKVIVDEIVFSADNNVATAGPAPEPTTGAFYTKGVIDMNKTFEVGSGNIGLWDVTDAEKQMITLTAANFNPADLEYDAEDAAARATADDSYMMIIPQDFSTGGLYVWIKYRVITEDAKLTDSKSEITNQICKQVAINFEQGKAYTLNLVLGLTEVKLDATVDEWDEQDPVQIDLPANSTNP